MPDTNPKPPFFDEIRKVSAFIDAFKDPATARAFLNGTICNLIGHISEPQWRAMLFTASEPCGRPGCQCHIAVGEFMQALNDQRDDWKETTAR